MNFRSLASAVLLASQVAVLAADSSATGNTWSRWRGNQDLGSVEHGSYPVTFSADTGLLWKTSLPGKGCSTPIVLGHRLFVTVPVDGQDAVVCYDWAGKESWRTVLGQESPGKHRNGSGSNPSPITDGHAVYALYKSGRLAAVDLEGKVLWKTDLVERFGKSTLYWDFGTSPVLTSSGVVVAIMHQGESYLASFAPKTGDLQWKVPRNYSTPVENDHSYATPIVVGRGKSESLVVWGAEHLTAHSPKDGSLTWSCGEFNPEGKANWVAVSSPVIVGDIAVVPFGRGSRLHGIRLGGSGDVTRSNRVWMREGTGTFVPSPVAYKGKVYMVRDRGEVECVDPATGTTLWSDALPKSSGSYYASPTIAGGNLYAPREDGVVFVAKIEGGFGVLSTNTMGEQLIASAVPVAGRLLLRGEKTLFCAGTPPKH